MQKPCRVVTHTHAMHHKNIFVFCFHFHSDVKVYFYNLSAKYFLMLAHQFLEFPYFIIFSLLSSTFLIALQQTHLCGKIKVLNNYYDLYTQH